MIDEVYGKGGTAFTEEELIDARGEMHADLAYASSTREKPLILFVNRNERSKLQVTIDYVPTYVCQPHNLRTDTQLFFELLDSGLKFGNGGGFGRGSSNIGACSDLVSDTSEGCGCNILDVLEESSLRRSERRRRPCLPPGFPLFVGDQKINSPGFRACLHVRTDEWIQLDDMCERKGRTSQKCERK